MSIFITGGFQESDFLIKYAQRSILSDFSDRVSVFEKDKQLLKFGRNESVGTSEATIMTLPSGQSEETYVSSNIIDTISSNNSSDTQEVVIEGHTISGSDLTFSSQTATLNGQNKVTLSTPLARATRVYNNGSADLLGSVFVYEDLARS